MYKKTRNKEYEDEIAFPDIITEQTIKSKRVFLVNNDE